MESKPQKTLVLATGDFTWRCWTGKHKVTYSVEAKFVDVILHAEGGDREKAHCLLYEGEIYRVSKTEYIGEAILFFLGDVVQGDPQDLIF